MTSDSDRALGCAKYDDPSRTSPSPRANPKLIGVFCINNGVFCIAEDALQPLRLGHMSDGKYRFSIDIASLKSECN
jgi:hypothetical protein